MSNKDSTSEQQKPHICQICLHDEFCGHNFDFECEQAEEYLAKGGIQNKTNMFYWLVSISYDIWFMCDNLDYYFHKLSSFLRGGDVKW